MRVAGEEPHLAQTKENRELSVQLRRGESVDSLLKRFRKSVAASGVLGQVRRKRWHVSKGELRRMKKKKGIRKAKRKQRQRDRRDAR